MVGSVGDQLQDRQGDTLRDSLMERQWTQVQDHLNFRVPIPIAPDPSHGRKIGFDINLIVADKPLQGSQIDNRVGYPGKALGRGQVLTLLGTQARQGRQKVKGVGHPMADLSLQVLG